MKIIHGQQLAEQLLDKVRSRVSILDIVPRLDIIMVGQDFASGVYVDKKKEWGNAIGIDVQVHNFEDISENKLIEQINLLNRNAEVHGIIVQLPLPKTINSENVFLNIWPEKDVDGLNPISLGLTWQNSTSGFIPATPLGVLECLKFIATYQNDEFNYQELETKVVEEELKTYLGGKRILIINRSNIVGKPLAALLLKYNSTVTIAHSKSLNIKELALNSDIIISGTGKPGFITKDMIPDKAILIDVGINNTATGIGGDIDYRGADDRIDWITPVPGGVGPLTVAMLLSNTLAAARKQIPSNS